MFNPALVQWIIRHYYNVALIDGNAKKQAHPEAIFCKNFVKAHPSIDNNYALHSNT